MQKNKIIVISLAVVLVVSLFTGGLGFSNVIHKVFAGRVAKNTIGYINKNLLPQGMTASLKSVAARRNGLYEVKFEIAGKEYNSFVSSDGKFLFPESISLAESKVKTATSTKDIPKKDKTEVKLFVMAFCPYGNQAEDLIRPVADLLGDKIKLELHYIVSKEGKEYNSLHGAQELTQGVRELCVQKYQKDKFWKFVSLINKNATSDNADKTWERLARSLDMNVQQIRDCQKKELSSMLDQEIKLTGKYGVSGSPTLVINDVTYNGDRTADSYKEAVCSGFKNQPKECKTKLSNEKTADSQAGCK
jgi:glutaredoxin